MGRMTKAQKENQRVSRETLRQWLPPGSTVYGTVVQVSRSGMSRHITFHIASVDKETGQARIEDISWHVARALGYRRDQRDGGLIVGGCGMDMAFHVIHSLSYALHGYPPHPGQETELRTPEQMAQDAARLGPLAPGVKEPDPTGRHPTCRTPGYTLTQGRM